MVVLLYVLLQSFLFFMMVLGTWLNGLMYREATSFLQPGSWPHASSDVNMGTGVFKQLCLPCSTANNRLVIYTLSGVALNRQSRLS